ncbi:MAG: FecR domain-containing protein [Bacteroidota bacterium]
MKIPYDLIGQYLSGEATDEQVTELMAWRKASKSNEEAFLQVMTTWGHSFNDVARYESVREQAYEQTWQRIRSKDSNGFKTWWAIAASIVLLLGGWITFRTTTGVDDIPHLVYESAQDSIRQLTLPDGSSIWLNKASAVTYVAGFEGKERSVTLDGEAYFEVTRNEDKPFVITAGNSKTTVLGTAFNLRAGQDQAIYLTVTEGKVRFGDETSGMVAFVEVGEEATLSPDRGSIDKTPSTDANALAWKTGKLVFEGKKLKEIASHLTRYYGVNYQVDQTLENSAYTFTLDQYSMEDANALIENITGLKIVEKDKTYHITP